MKIFLPTIQYPPDAGGVAKVAHEQAMGLAALGEQVQVYAPHTEPDETTTPAPNVQLRRPTLRTRAVLRLLPLIRGVDSAMRGFAPDFALCPTYRAIGLPLMLAARRRRVPYSIYIHGTELHTEHKSGTRRWVMEHVLSGAAFLATNSHNTQRLLVELYPKVRTRVAVVHPGVDPDRFSHERLAPLRDPARADLLARLAKQAGSPPASGSGTPVIMLSACRLCREKGVDVVLRELAALLARGPAMPLLYVVAGEGPDAEAFRGQAASLGLAQRVLFTGPASYDEIPRLFAAADFYIQPSQPVGDFLESFGISFVEAQAAGLPCIGSDWGGVPEAVARDESAILIKPGDNATLRQAMQTLATNMLLRRRMGDAGRPHAARFTWAAHAARLREEIHAAVRGAR